MKNPGRFHLFEVFGIELEYMIVDRDTLDVKPILDKLLHDLAGAHVNEVERGAIAWSNELVLHVIELKTNGPARDLAGLHEDFQKEVVEVNSLLKKYNAMLMPGPMHPWMDPYKEMHLWPHDYNPIYEAYNRIFDCRGHGWANLQSTHINLPFEGDEEFEKLHAAIRIILPVLPALSAGSPVADLERKPHSDYRMEVYRTNSKKVPSVTGWIVPEAAFSYQEYDDKIFQPMYRDIDPFDTDDILKEEWLNSRGAIAHFGRGSIEIRVLDVQECPLADLAIVRFVTDVLKALVDEKWSGRRDQKSWNEKQLYAILLDVMKDAENTVIGNREYLSLFGMPADKKVTAGELWSYLFEELYSEEDIVKSPVLQAMQRMLQAGTLSTRLGKALPSELNRAGVAEVYRSLCSCLSQGKLFGIDG